MQYSAMISNISLRAAAPEDAPFFYRVIAETMRDHVVAIWGAWNEERVQSECRERVRSANARIIMAGDDPAGIFTVGKHNDHIHLDQIMLLEPFQRKGIGGVLVRQLITEAFDRRVPLRLRVLRGNSALHFYERLGFLIIEQTPERTYMAYQAPRN